MSKKILVIEDHPDMRDNIREILELSRYLVRTAANGKEGVEMVKQDKPDLILCDVTMPVLDGFGVLHLLSRDEQTSGIPFIFLTAKAERTDFRKGMEMGADDFITKPFDDIELLRAIESRFKKADSLRHDYERSAAGINDFINGAKGFDELKKLSDAMDVNSYKKKDAIYHSGSFPKGVFFINKGRVKVFKTHEDGKEFITGLFTQGDFFGYPALLEDTAHADSATALEESEIGLIPKEDFFALLHNNAEVSRKFINLLSGNLQEREEQLLRLAYNSVRKRVAAALVNLSSHYNTAPDEIFSISISRQDLASLAGTAVETTIRTLGEFKEEGMVHVQAGSISLLDINRLNSLRN